MENNKKQFSSDLISNLEVLTKQGQRNSVLKTLIKTIKDNPPQDMLPQLARFANRNHAYVLALRILHKIIRDDREKIRPASHEALNIYATSLMWIGALEESEKCLQRIKGQTDAYLTEAFVNFAQWNYDKAIPLLYKYINSTQINPYQRLVGQINLLAALIGTGRLIDARMLAGDLEESLKAGNHKILLGNCYELCSQIEILEGSYSAALMLLKKSEVCLEGQPGRYLLYVNKWRAIAELGISNTNFDAKESLLKIKSEALKLKNWETIRDCDFHLARLTHDEDLMQRLLLGTPYKGYHERTAAFFGVQKQNSNKLVYCPGDLMKTPLKIELDLSSIQDINFIHSTSWPLLQVMTKDIYRPPRMGVVFSALYGDEFFDPYTSPQRIRNSVFRFNNWAVENSNEFRVRISEGDFFLTAPEGYGVSCHQSRRPLQDWEALLNLFKQQNGSRSFTSAQFAKALGVSQKTAVNLIKRAMKSRKIEKIDQGRNSRYILFSGRRSAS